jgi:hypothetical protein
VTYNAKNRIFCFSRVVVLVELRTGRQVGTKIPRVAVSATDQRIITAFPTNSQCGS